MSNAAVEAELRITLKDQTGTGLKSVEQAGITAAAKMAESFSRSAATQTQTLSTLQESHVTAWRRMAEARETLGIRAERTIRDELRQTQAAYEHLASSGALSGNEQARAAEAARSKVAALRRELGEVEKLTLRQRLAGMADAAPTLAAGAYAGFRVEKSFLQKFALLEDAQTELRVSMTNKAGQVSDQFQKTLSVATELGNKLPGTTRDFVMEAQALKQMAIPDAVIANGGLRAAGLLRVGMNLHGEGEAGGLVARNMHSFGLKDTELVSAADQTYRLYRAFGQKARDITEANTYMGATLNQLGWTGAENMKSVQAMQGMMATKGLEASVFGTNFADMLSFVARMQTRLKGKGAETREVKEILHRHKVELNLFDKAGKFVGPDEFLRQIAKLGVLNQKEQVEVFHKLFGQQGERAATALVAGGPEAVQDAKKKIDNLLSLEESVGQQSDTFSRKLEALTGSAENMAAAIGKPIGDALKGPIDKLNDWVGKATEVFEKNPTLAAGAGIAAGVGAAGAAALGWRLLSAALSGAGVPVRVVNGAGLPLPGGPAGGAAGGAGEGAAGAGAAKAASRFAPLASAAYATAPLAVMYGATEWAGDPSDLATGQKSRERAGGFAGFSEWLANTLGMNKEAEWAARRERNREGLEVNGNFTVALAPGLVLQQQSLLATGGNVTLNTGNIWNGAPH